MNESPCLPHFVVAIVAFRRVFLEHTFRFWIMHLAFSQANLRVMTFGSASLAHVAVSTGDRHLRRRRQKITYLYISLIAGGTPYGPMGGKSSDRTKRNETSRTRPIRKTRATMGSDAHRAHAVPTPCAARTTCDSDSLAHLGARATQASTGPE